MNPITPADNLRPLDIPNLHVCPIKDQPHVFQVWEKSVCGWPPATTYYRGRVALNKDGVYEATVGEYFCNDLYAVIATGATMEKAVVRSMYLTGAELLDRAIRLMKEAAKTARVSGFDPVSGSDDFDASEIDDVIASIDKSRASVPA